MTKLLALLLGGAALLLALSLLAQSQAPPARPPIVTLVQHTVDLPQLPGSAVGFVLPTLPVPGDLLLAFTSYSHFGAARELTAPGPGWVKVADLTRQFDALAVWWHRVVAGDGAQWSFPVIGPPEWHSGVLLELRGASPTMPIATSSILGASTVTAGTPISALGLGCLPLSGVTLDQASTVASLGMGWTLTALAQPAYHQTFVATHAPTTTLAPLSDGWSFTGGGVGVDALVLVCP
jgi:hypothetical protein